MTPLYHLALRSDWDAAQAAGVYEMSTRGVTLAQEGFIHCSLRHQVDGVARRFYADLDDAVLTLLVIDPALLDDTTVRYEPPAPGLEDFPHLYGPLPLSAVVARHPLVRDSAGGLVLPDGPADPAVGGGAA